MRGKLSAVSCQLSEKPDGPSVYVLMAIFHRMHEWEQEVADQAEQVKALEMRGKKSFTTKGTKAHKGNTVTGRRIVRRKQQS